MLQSTVHISNSDCLQIIKLSEIRIPRFRCRDRPCNSKVQPWHFCCHLICTGGWGLDPTFRYLSPSLIFLHHIPIFPVTHLWRRIIPARRGMRSSCKAAIPNFLAWAAKAAASLPADFCAACFAFLSALKILVFCDGLRFSE